MEHEVRAECERLLPRGRQKRVVHDGQCTGGPAQRCEFFDIRDSQKRVARRLDPKQGSRLGERSPDRSFITEVDEFDLSLAALPPCLEQPVSSAVAIMRSDDASTGRYQVADQGDCGHTSCGNDAANAELQLGYRRPEQIALRIA